MNNSNKQSNASIETDGKSSSEIERKNSFHEAKKKAAIHLGAEAATLAAATVGVASGTLPIAVAIPFVSGVFSTLSSRYSSLPVNKRAEPIQTVNEKWKSRPKSNMVKWLMQRSGTSLDTVAAYLGCSVNYLNNKLSRDSFSFDDLMLVAYACGYTFILTNNNEEVINANSYRVDLLSFFEGNDPDTLSRISRIEEAKQLAARKEYEAKKAELERLKAEYGFDD